MGDEGKIMLYHYTNKEGADAIKKSKVIRASTWSGNNDDAAFGDGVYFTSIDPLNDPTSILINNFDDADYVINSKPLWEKIEWVIEVSIPRDEVKKAPAFNRDVYLYKGNVNLDLYHSEIYKNPML